MVDVTINDLMQSETARRLGIDNSLPAGREAKCMESLGLVVRVLNDVQRRFSRPVVVTSGYRCEALNKAVGGVPNSQHMLGEAVDFYVHGVPLLKVFCYLVNEVEFVDQAILYRAKGIIHLSARPSGCVRKSTFIK